MVRSLDGLQERTASYSRRRIKHRNVRFLAFPVFQRDGAPEEIRTPDPQIRSLVAAADIPCNRDIRHPEDCDLLALKALVNLRRRHCRTPPDMLSVLPARYPSGAHTMRLTVRSVETMRPAAERREIPDGIMPGLYLIVQPSGAKSWAVRYRHQGQPRKHTIGSFPTVDLKTARLLGGKALRAAAEGRDPGREKMQARAAKADSIDQRRRRISRRAMSGAQTARERRKKQNDCFDCMSCRAGAGARCMRLRAATCSTCSTELLMAAPPLPPTARWLPCESFSIGVWPATSSRSRLVLVSSPPLRNARATAF